MVELGDAWRTLGIAPCDDAHAVRRAFVERLFDVHPDRSGAADAHDATIELRDAFTTICAHIRHQPAATAPQPPATVIAIGQLTNDTVGIGAPPDEAFRILLDAAERLGEVAFVDSGARLFQVIIEFVEEPVCQLVVAFQGRASGVTEAFCTIESLEPRSAPPIEAVTRLLVTTASAR